MSHGSTDGRVVVVAMPGDEALADALVRGRGAEPGTAEVRRFPDGESYVRLGPGVAGRTLVVACTLREPDLRLVPLLLLAATARDLAATRVGLVAPYLPYMRQDGRFRDGEGVTSVYVGRLLSGAVDWLVTVDPHLHRHRTLADTYQIPATAVGASAAIAAWLRTSVETPVLVGPDRESAQWVEAVAREASVPALVLEKVRHGDRDV